MAYDLTLDPNSGLTLCPRGAHLLRLLLIFVLGVLWRASVSFWVWVGVEKIEAMWLCLVINKCKLCGRALMVYDTEGFGKISSTELKITDTVFVARFSE